jgi:hypothetical protein
VVELNVRMKKKGGCMEDKLYVFNYAQNRDKLFANLISIIDSIVADGVVKDEEVLYLDTWLLEARQIISNGVIKSLSLRVSDILADGVVTDAERTDLKNIKSDTEKILISQVLICIPRSQISTC